MSKSQIPNPGNLFLQGYVSSTTNKATLLLFRNVSVAGPRFRVMIDFVALQITV